MDDTGKEPIITTPSTSSLWAKLGLTAASIAAIGAVGGAFYLGTVFSNAPLERKSVAATETTGSAPAQVNAPKETQAAASESAPVEAADAANCREQTWPYIARPCLANAKSLANEKGGANEKGERGVRVISTDKLADPVINVVETPPDAVINRKTVQDKTAQEPPKAQAAVSAPAIPNIPASEAPSLNSGASLGAVATAPAVAAPVQAAEPAIASAPQSAEPPAQPVVAPATPQPALQATAAVEPQAATEKRLEKSKRKAAKRRDERIKENERFKTVTAQSDDDDEPVVEKKNSRIKGRIVERWTERDYNVPSHDGGGRRRVIVTNRDDTDRERSVSIERGGGFPNIFGAIFGSRD